ncbi:lantibiotic dehydratase [Streptomyces sp. NPDC045431]|uniref:lantibiotic dehydratase n=1 Tax=Streptomyces sp. NPDC045431 TaxID=3155613 RepID=UPI0033DC0FBD
MAAARDAADARHDAAGPPDAPRASNAPHASNIPHVSHAPQNPGAPQTPDVRGEAAGAPRVPDAAGAPDPGGVRDRALGATALLRVAGMPCDAWTAAASPGLFERVVRQADADDRRAERARLLADRLGADVVPHPGLTGADRGAVLALRRRLHSGAAPGAADCRLLERSPAVPAHLAAEARALLHATGTAAAGLTALEQAVAAEQERIAVQAWDTARSNPVLRTFLAAAAPGLTEDVERRLAEGQSWTGRQLRKRTAYIWRVLGRAAAKTTPRGWAGQIAALPVTAAPDGSSLLAPGTAALGALAATAMENIHLVRTRIAPLDLRTADPATLLVPAPLHFTEPATAPEDPAGRLRAYVVDPREPGRLRQVVLRRTRVLEVVLALLADGPCPLGELEKTVLGAAAPPGGAPAADPAVLRGFLQHLLSMGVLQVCTAPRHRYSPWVRADAVTATGTLPHPDTPAATDPGGWFLDAYRALAPGATVPVPAAERVLRGLRIAARIAALREAEGHPDVPPQARPEIAALTERPRPVSEILADRLSAADGPPPVLRRYGGWAPARDPGSGYARLLEHLDAAARSGAERVDVDDALLDALGAPRGRDAVPPWPVDCLLRPLPPHTGPGPVAVLETASAAGVLDARFADALRTLYGGYGNADAYRDFLAAVERRTGVRFVELLVPPLAERAANAVRRPVATTWWTGDPDPTPYYGPLGAHARYLPLDRITVRRSGRRIIAEADGQRIVPVHHATRSPVPPYDVLVRILLAASHPAASWLVRLDGLDAALPDRRGLPRLTAGGELVLSPATWRLRRAHLWHPGDSLLAKVRTLALLRRDTALPRHAFIRTGPGAKPVPVDFDSLTALHLVERLCAQQAGDEILVEEMLPAPGDLLLRDPLHGGAAVAAQALLRLPCDQGAERLAVAAADALLRGDAQDLPGPPARRPAGVDTTQ